VYGRGIINYCVTDGHITKRERRSRVVSTRSAGAQIISAGNHETRSTSEFSFSTRPLFSGGRGFSARGASARISWSSRVTWHGGRPNVGWATRRPRPCPLPLPLQPRTECLTQSGYPSRRHRDRRRFLCEQAPRIRLSIRIRIRIRMRGTNCTVDILYVL
jgi:hypothetical protein